MTFTGNGGARVSAPLCEERPYGLASVAEMDERPGFEWARGLEYDQVSCSGRPSTASMPCPPPPEELQKQSKRGFDTLEAAAFVVYDGWSCSAGASDVRAAWDNAEQLLARTWKWGLERAFWEGTDQDGNLIDGSLAHGGAFDLTPPAGALDPVSGVATLEAWMADNSACLPTIHANVGVGAYWSAHGMLLREGGGLRMLTGSKVALGGGYADTGPLGAEPGEGEAYIYVTGPVRVTTGPTFFTPERGDVAGAVNHGPGSTNDATVYAEKMFAVQRACGVAAVLITLSNCCG